MAEGSTDRLQSQQLPLNLNMTEVKRNMIERVQNAIALARWIVPDPATKPAGRQRRGPGEIIGGESAQMIIDLRTHAAEVGQGLGEIARGHEFRWSIAMKIRSARVGDNPVSGRPRHVHDQLIESVRW